MKRSLVDEVTTRTRLLCTSRSDFRLLQGPSLSWNGLFSAPFYNTSLYSMGSSLGIMPVAISGMTPSPAIQKTAMQSCVVEHTLYAAHRNALECSFLSLLLFFKWLDYMLLWFGWLVNDFFMDVDCVGCVRSKSDPAMNTCTNVGTSTASHCMIK